MKKNNNNVIRIINNAQFASSTKTNDKEAASMQSCQQPLARHKKLKRIEDLQRKSGTGLDFEGIEASACAFV